MDSIAAIWGEISSLSKCVCLCLWIRFDFTAARSLSVPYGPDVGRHSISGVPKVQLQSIAPLPLEAAVLPISGAYTRER